MPFLLKQEDGDKTGYLYQVTGNVQTGMVYEHRKESQPEMSLSFGGLKRFISTVTHNNHVHIRGIVDGIPPPKKQFNRTKRIYPNEPLRRYQKWTKDAIQALADSSILQPPHSGNSTDSHWTYDD